MSTIPEKEVSAHCWLLASRKISLRRENSRKLSEFKWNPEAGLRFIVPLSDPGLPPVTRGEGISSGTNSQVQLVVLSTPQ